MDGVVLVQPKAPNDLLLGSDFQPKLGFRLVMETPEMFVDLLTGEEHQHKNKDQSTTGPPLCEEETRTIQTPEGAIWERPQTKNFSPHPLPFPPVDKEVDNEAGSSVTGSPMACSTTPHRLAVATAPDVCSEETARVTTKAP